MKNLKLESPELEEKEFLTRDQLKQIVNRQYQIINDGGTSGTCHYNCVYDDSMGNPHTYNYTGTACSSNSDCTNTAPCSMLANGNDWVVSQTCS